MTRIILQFCMRLLILLICTSHAFGVDIYRLLDPINGGRYGKSPSDGPPFYRFGNVQQYYHIDASQYNNYLSAVGSSFSSWNNAGSVQFSSSSSSGLPLETFWSDYGHDIDPYLVNPGVTYPASNNYIINTNNSYVQLNTYHQWGIVQNLQQDKFDVETVLVHELGHIHGLAHPLTGSYSHDANAPIMAGGDNEYCWNHIARNLKTDDINGTQYLQYNIWVPGQCSTIYTALANSFSGVTIHISNSQSLSSNILVPNGITIKFETGSSLSFNNKYIVSTGGTIIDQSNGGVVCAYLKQGGVLKGLFPTVQSALNYATSGQEVELCKASTLQANANIPNNITFRISTNLDLISIGYYIASTGGTIINYYYYVICAYVQQGSTIKGYFPTIQSAINYATSGQTVYLQSRTYNESTIPFTNKSNILVDGRGVNNSIINGSVQASYAQWFTIRNLKVIGMVQDLWGYHNEMNNLDVQNLISLGWNTYSKVINCEMTTSTNYGIAAGYSIIDVVQFGHIKNKILAGLRGDNVNMTCDQVVFCINTSSNGMDVISGVSADWISLHNCGFSSPVEGSTVSGPGQIMWNWWTNCSSMPKATPANEILAEMEANPSDLEKLSVENKTVGKLEYEAAMESYKMLREKIYTEKGEGLIDLNKYEGEYNNIVSQFREIIKMYPGSVAALKSLQNILGCYVILQKPDLGNNLVNELLTDKNQIEVRSHIKNLKTSLLEFAHSLGQNISEKTFKGTGGIYYPKSENIHLPSIIGKSKELSLVKYKSYQRRKLHEDFGGQRQGGISTPAGKNYLFLFTGEQGQKYGYQDKWTEDGIFLLTGEGQRGDMEITKGNEAIANHIRDGKDLHLFQYMKKRGYVKYIGQMVCIGYRTEEGLDIEGNKRKLVKFELNPIESYSPENELETYDDLTDQSLEDLREKALAASEQKRTPTERKSQSMYRSQAIKAYILKRANGNCEACGNPAPFLTMESKPYLESHHIFRRSDGGPDHPSSVIALCPNCHRKSHYSRERDELKEELSRIVKKIENEL